ncbi:MAG: cobyric acid synthase [Halobacteria archaeon]|nr:cobyric acid synthase [Halobacteria archaeon]
MLVLGTSSHAGKSTVVTALCRFLSDEGYEVAPFKAQNMSNNSWVTSEGGEMGISQAVQAWAARKEPSVEMNPVLLKPKGDGVSQVILLGDVHGDRETTEYYDEFDEMRRHAREAYERLADENDVVVAEGAGGAAEINLHDRDLSNIETARFTDSSVLLVADIERGGVFASVYGTVELLPDDIRENLEGIIINKFRGSLDVLEPGLEDLEDLTGVPVLGVLPHTDLDLPSEDSLSIDDRSGGGSEDASVEVGVVRLPHISNFTDFEPLEADPRVSLRYIDLDSSLDDPDAVVIPGTKNTADDLVSLRDTDLFDEIRSYGGVVVGICGGYQMLGESIIDEGAESVADERQEIEGLDLLPVRTRFDSDDEKTTRQVELRSGEEGILSGFEDTVEGYEIHMGETEALGDDDEVEVEVETAFGDDGFVTHRVLGTYLHGLFSNDGFREFFVKSLGGAEKDLDVSNPYDEAARLVRQNLDTDVILEMAESEKS